MDEIEFISSSYGPYGKTKIVIGCTGTILLTKDCQQLLDSLSHTQQQHSHTLFPSEDTDTSLSSLSSPLTQLILKMCRSHSQRYGDGGMTALIIATSLLRQGTEILEATTARAIRYRVEMLGAMSCINDMIHKHRELITNTLTELGIWFRFRLTSQVLENIWKHILIPASNTHLAENLCSILMSWFQATNWFSLDPNSQLELLRYTVTNFDDIILTSTSDTLTASYNVPADQMIFEGRCRDISSLHTSTQLQTLSQYLFLCLRHVQAIGEDSENTENDREEETQGQGKVISPIVRLSSTLDINNSIGSAVGFHVVSELLTHLHQKFQTNPKNLLVVVCSESIHDCLHFHATNCSIILIDGVASNQLDYLANRSRIPVFDSARELISHLECYPSDRSFLSHFRSLEKIVLGKGDPYLRMHGMKRSIQAKRELPSQLVLRGCSSIAIGGIYRRLIRRCLTATIASVRSCPGSEINCSLGGGVSEMIWAILWEEIAKNLETNSNSTPSCSPFQLMAQDLSASLREYLKRVSRQKSYLVSLVSCCRHISGSYFAIPLLLFANSHQHSSVSYQSQRSVLLWRKDVEQYLYTHCQHRPSDELEGQKLLPLITSLGVSSSSAASPSSVYYLTESFFEVFSIVLESLRINLRVGGRSGVVKISTKSNC